MKYIVLVTGLLLSLGSFFLLHQGAYIDTWLFLLFISGLVLIGWSVFYSHISFFFNKYKKTRKTLTLFVLFCFILFLVLESCILSSTKNEEAPNVSYVLVLGTEIENGQPSLTLKKRLDKACDYVKTHSNVKVITTGGIEKGETLSEAQIMKHYLVSQGINGHRILTENRSKNTFENFLYSKQKFPDIQQKNVLLITSDFHLFRAKFLAKRTEVNVVATQFSRVPFYLIIQNHIRECAAILKSYVFDKK